jgi:cell division protein FtsB
MVELRGQILDWRLSGQNIIRYTYSMRSNPRRLTLFMSIFAVILISYFVLRAVFAARTAIPADFLDARAQGAILAQDIVNTSNAINGEIGHINDLDKNKDYVAALDATEGVKKNTQYLRERAIDLSKELKTMTQDLPSITPDAAQQAALDSISSRLALISRLITYTDDVNQFLSALALHFQNKNAPPQDIAQLVTQINTEVKAINTFNSQAGQAMDRFDATVR